MRFYKKTNGEWVVGSFEGVPAGSCTRTINDTTGEVEIINRSTGMVYTKGVYSQYKDINGAAYASLAALRTAGEGLFTGAVDNTEVIASVDGSGLIYRSFKAKLIRPANTTAYTAGDTIGDVTTLFKEIQNVALAAGYGVHIYRARIQTNDTGFGGKVLNIQVYCDVPNVTGLADNTEFTLAWANAEKRVGEIPILMKTGKKSVVGQNNVDVMGCNPAARSLYYILETGNDATPSANSTEFWIFFDCILSRK